MSLARRWKRLWNRRAAPPSTGIFVLNHLVGVPTSLPTKPYEAGPTSGIYLFDCNYIDRDRTLAGVARLAELCRDGQFDLTSKTLLLSIKGLHPVGDQLLGIGRAFRRSHHFFELWNGLKEIVALAKASPEHLYFVPVSARLRDVTAPHVAPVPNRNVFVSLGGDDDLDLIRQVINRCPELRFFVPTVSWTKPGSEKRFLDVRLPGANVTAVDCARVQERQQLSFSRQYRAAYAACDTVLIATTADKMFQLRGGVRFADALYARKRIVITENPMCQLLMADHGRTCLVAAHDVEAVAASLMRACTSRFHVQTDVYEQIRHLTVDSSKLAWMIEAVQGLQPSRRSLFARNGDLLEVARRSLFEAGRRLLDREIGEQV